MSKGERERVMEKNKDMRRSGGQNEMGQEKNSKVPNKNRFLERGQNVKRKTLSSTRIELVRFQDRKNGSNKKPKKCGTRRDSRP